ncbi:MAG TPA: TetR/AcrR family transcriptional regulator [Solirubrobacteraceae bacterium]|jgi:AcrR family transcriptional regulator
MARIVGLQPRRTPVQDRSLVTVQAILEAAAQVFERYGYAAGTTNRIAERAGVSIGSLYQYFPNKDAILVALVRRHVAEGTAILWPHVERLQAGGSLDDVIEDVVAAMVALHAIAPRLHRVLFEETPLPTELRSELDAMEDALVEILAGSLRATDEIVGTDLYVAARMIVGSVEGLTHRLVLRPPDGASTDVIATEITTLIRAYLRGLRSDPV